MNYMGIERAAFEPSEYEARLPMRESISKFHIGAIVFPCLVRVGDEDEDVTCRHAPEVARCRELNALTRVELGVSSRSGLQFMGFRRMVPPLYRHNVTERFQATADRLNPFSE